jgi:OpgC protein
LWMAGLALGTINAESLSEAAAAGTDKSEVSIAPWVLKLSFAVAGIFLILRYMPLEHWVDLDKYGWLIDKWHLGPARLIDFAAIAILLVRYGARIAALPFMKPLASLGQASIEVFSVHVLCCLGGVALSNEADPQLPWWQQILLLAVTISALFLTAHLQHRWTRKKHATGAA